MLELYKKIDKIQKEIGKLAKKSDNPFFKSKYLELNDLTDALQPLLEKEKLMLIQPIERGYLITKVIDTETGKEFISELELPPLDNPQKIGSCITYYRRYTLKSMFQIQEIDDDGNLAAKPVEEKAPEKAKNPLTPKSGAWKKGVEQGVSIEKMKEHYTFTELNEKAYMVDLGINKK